MDWGTVVLLSMAALAASGAIAVVTIGLVIWSIAKRAMKYMKEDGE